MGERFGRLLVVGIEPSLKGKRMVRALCDCGEEVVRRLSLVAHGHTRSCGCMRGKRDDEVLERPVTPTAGQHRPSDTALIGRLAMALGDELSFLPPITLDELARAMDTDAEVLAGAAHVLRPWVEAACVEGTWVLYGRRVAWGEVWEAVEGMRRLDVVEWREAA